MCPLSAASARQGMRMNESLRSKTRLILIESDIFCEDLKGVIPASTYAYSYFNATYLTLSFHIAETMHIKSIAYQACIIDF